MLRNLKRCLARPSCALFAAPTARSRSYRTKHARLLFETLESRQMLSMGPLEISEFMAVNRTTWRDGEDEYEDWIEIHNPTADVVDLTGWHLTDEAENLSKWTFPVESIDPGEHLLVFASGSGRPDAAGNLHTNFKLDGDGEYLALVQDNEGTLTISYAYSQEYPYEFPQQAADISYGLSDGQERYLPWATPGLPNDSELVLINEFMTINDTTLQDGDEEYSDWIELYNPTNAPIVLDGWYLTDDEGDPTQWSFPAGLNTTLQPGGYLVVFASGQDVDDYVDPAGNLHTNFKLSGSDGEYLGLYRPDESLVGYDYYPEFQIPQHADVSYGILDTFERDWFFHPTPRDGNETVPLPLTFSDERGFYEHPEPPNPPMEVAITSTAPDTVIYYTLDGSEPDWREDPPVGQLYTGPISVDTTTTLRVSAHKDGYRDVRTTHTYVFLDDVLAQTEDPPGLPEELDFEMDERVVGPEDLFEGKYVATILEDLKAIPSISLVTSYDDYVRG